MRYDYPNMLGGCPKCYDGCVWIDYTTGEPIARCTHCLYFKVIIK